MFQRCKKLWFSLLIVLIIFITGCKTKPLPNPPVPSASSLTIYTVNDFHGSIEETDGKKGIARIAGYINQHKKDKEAVLILSAGDMFQGSGLSNYSHGASVIEMMNDIGFDAMALGNHEFDWGIDEILKYRDGSKDNTEANFPFLSCNIFHTDTDSQLENTQNYAVINKSGIKIGVIGYIGLGLEADIATSVISGYEFRDPVAEIKKHAKTLRVEEECDVVIALGHDGDSSTNYQIASLKDEYRVDAIINGHTHSQYTETYKVASTGYEIPIIQSGSAGSHVGLITINLDKETKEPITSMAYNKRMDSDVIKDVQMEAKVNKLISDTAHIFKEELCEAGTLIDKTICGNWSVRAMQEAMGTDFAFTNTGGIRANAFPIEKGSKVLVSNVYTIMPFDNTVKTCRLLGKYIKSLLRDTKLYGYGLIDYNQIEDETLYTVAAVDYIFDDSGSYPFYLGSNQEFTGNLFRDIMINKLREMGKNEEKWMG